MEPVVLDALESKCAFGANFASSSEKLIDRMNAQRDGASNFPPAK